MSTEWKTTAFATEPAAGDIGGAPLAPWWHTVLLILLLAGTSVAGYLTTRRVHAAELHRSLSYVVTMAWEWLLAGICYVGLRLRHTPLRRVLGVRRPGIHAWLEDAGIAVGFWLGSLLILGALALLLKPLHVNAESIRGIVAKLAPSNLLELLLWVGVSLTAGVCEEFLFRGYFQQQFTVWTRRAWAGVLCSAVLFGCGHGYEGLAGMLLITAYGALFGILAHVRRSLRAGAMAHTWHDALSGFALFFAHHYAGLLPR